MNILRGRSVDERLLRMIERFNTEDLALEFGVPVRELESTGYPEIEKYGKAWASHQPRKFSSSHRPTRRRRGTAKPLTDRQQRIVELYVKHNGSIKAIAGELGISSPTVSKHWKAIVSKAPELQRTRAHAGRTRKLPKDRRGQLSE